MSDNDNIEWAQLPTRAGRPKGSGRTQRFVEALKKRPGQWAVYDRKAQRPGVGVYSGQFPGTQWSVRRTGPEEFTIYARWVGDK